MSTPEREGWYWHRASDQHVWACVEVYRENCRWWWSPQRSLIDNAYCMDNHADEQWVWIPVPEQLDCIRRSLGNMVSYTVLYGESAGELASSLLSAWHEGSE